MKRVVTYLVDNWGKILIFIALPIPVAMAVVPFISTRSQKIQKKIAKKWQSGKCTITGACDTCNLRDACIKLKH